MSNWSEVIKRANTDSTFREQLKADPTGTCRAAGCDLPRNATVEIVEKDRWDLLLAIGGKCGVPEIDKLLVDAASSASVKERLQSDPRAAIESATGQRLPAGTKVRIRDSQPNRFYLTLTRPAEQDQELSESELEAVAGGGFFRNVVNAFCPNNTRNTTTVTKDQTFITTAVDYSLGGYVEQGALAISANY